MKPTLQNIAIRFIEAILFIGSLAPRSQAQTSPATQTITLSVKELNAIDLIGGEVNLQITSVDETTNQPDPVVNASSKLLWTSNGENRKITVATNNTSARFSLRIVANNVSSAGAVAASEVILNGDAPKDLIRSVSRSAGSCTIRYTAMADVSEGTGTENHLVTYTITSG